MTDILVLYASFESKNLEKGSDIWHMTQMVYGAKKVENDCSNALIVVMKFYDDHFKN